MIPDDEITLTRRTLLAKVATISVGSVIVGAGSMRVLQQSGSAPLTIDTTHPEFAADEYPSLVFSAESVTPGESGSTTFPLFETGTADGDFTLTITHDYSSRERQSQASRLLADQLEYKLWLQRGSTDEEREFDPQTDQWLKPGGEIVYGTISELTFAPATDFQDTTWHPAIDLSKGWTLNVEWRLPPTEDELDAATFETTFHLSVTGI